MSPTIIPIIIIVTLALGGIVFSVLFNKSSRQHSIISSATCFICGVVSVLLFLFVPRFNDFESLAFTILLIAFLIFAVYIIISLFASYVTEKHFESKRKAVPLDGHRNAAGREFKKKNKKAVGNNNSIGVDELLELVDESKAQKEQFERRTAPTQMYSRRRRKESEREEQLRLEWERQEQERLEQEKLEQERIELEQQQREEIYRMIYDKLDQDEDDVLSVDIFGMPGKDKEVEEQQNESEFDLTQEAWDYGAQEESLPDDEQDEVSSLIDDAEDIDVIEEAKEAWDYGVQEESLLSDEQDEVSSLIDDAEDIDVIEEAEETWDYGAQEESLLSDEQDEVSSLIDDAEDMEVIEEAQETWDYGQQEESLLSDEQDEGSSLIDDAEDMEVIGEAQETWNYEQQEESLLSDEQDEGSSLIEDTEDMEVIEPRLNAYESLVEKEDEMIFDASDDESEKIKKELIDYQKQEQMKIDRIEQMSAKAQELKEAGNYLLCAQIINKIKQIDIPYDRNRALDFELIDCYKKAENKDLLKKQVYEVLNLRYTHSKQEKDLLADALKFLK